ncbi:hypothetical protein K2173_011476 [Erythroxylum novogranatense]|uniref:Uncharacterized protein n=1 Tax=Erythroxylum novogranatense TaxID=1862640 RepID=A0AAV8TEI7_9ROSI|nr:hypothetical protein K2173_011476 [Erythroxylum novogranatense]
MLVRLLTSAYCVTLIKLKVEGIFVSRHQVSLADPYESKGGSAPRGYKRRPPHVPSTTTEVSLADPYESKKGNAVGKRKPPHVPSTATEVSLADPYESKKGSPVGKPAVEHPLTTTEVSLSDPYESKRGYPGKRPRHPPSTKDDPIDADLIGKAPGAGSRTNPPTKGPGGRRRCPKCSEFEAVDDEKNHNPLGGKPLTPGSKPNP